VDWRFLFGFTTFNIARSQFMVTDIGSPATANCKSRQARKGATVAGTLGAGVWLVLVAT